LNGTLTVLIANSGALGHGVLAQLKRFL